MKEKCTVYIDEAGDLGINRGTQWFVITAVIVKKDDEPVIRQTLKSIKTKFNLNDIHLRKINDFYKISYIVSQLKDLPFITINVLMDTSKWKLKNSLLSYNYMCRILLERASWYLRDMNMTGEVILSSRGTSRDSELIEYINKCIDYPQNEMANVFTKISSKTAPNWDMLQLADVCATSMFKAYEINKLGFITPCHMSILKDKIYTRNGNMHKYGLKFYEDNMIPDKMYFENHRLCNKK